ncbi:hypothetical protein DIURU_004327 [Diutina rugosa]|uniref:F-box domain-containing protein n=1 Tax=Diutina rugosa TaxID=5481 RepID=A0A642UHS2_DIURU|nr:uncharacterized protein DIURU_004327 [Diutina rugosa]KAA8899305.1 hypothetical protein DIURU_004327 [Diutina rugosa]
MANGDESSETKVSLASLPDRILKRIYSYLDVPSVCRAYVAFSPNQCAKVAAEVLKDCKVNVSIDAIDGDLDEINFDMLAKLPPCNVAVTATDATWVPSVERLNRLKLTTLEMIITEDFKEIDELFSQVILSHPIKTLRLTNVIVAIQCLPRNICSIYIEKCRVSGLKFFGVFNNLHDLTIVDSTYVPPEDPDEPVCVMLPSSLKEVTLPQYWHQIDYALASGLRYASTEISKPYFSRHTLETLAHTDIPRWEEMKNLKRIKVTEQGPDHRNSFKEINLPKLESVEIKRGLELNPQRTEASELFTESQMTQLIEFNAPDYCIKDFGPFKQLRSVHIILEEPLTKDLSLPPTLESLHVETCYPVESVPAQIRVLGINVFEKTDLSNRLQFNPDVTVASPKIRELSVSGAHNVSVSCVQLRHLTLKKCDGEMSLNTPNMNKVEITGMKHDDFAYITEKSSVSFVKLVDCHAKSLHFGHRLDKLICEQVLISSLRVEALKVRYSSEDATNVFIRADSAVIDIPYPWERLRLDIECRHLSTSIYRQLLYESVKSLTLWHKGPGVMNLPYNAFGSTKLERVILKNVTVARGFRIPDTVKTLIFIDMGGSTLDLDFDDDTQLQHLEIRQVNKRSIWNDQMKSISEKNLGFSKRPPICKFYGLDVLEDIDVDFDEHPAKRPRLEYVD